MLNSMNTRGPVILLSKDISYTFPFGYAYLASYLLDKGEDARIMFRPEDPNKYEKFIDEIISLKPLLVGFGTLYPDIYPVGELIRIFKEKNCDFPLVIGGQMVTPTPEFAAQITQADLAVVGEGELILYGLVQALRSGHDAKSVKGLIINEDGKTVNTGPGEFIRDMKDLPQVRYELFPSRKWLHVGKYYVWHPQPHWRYADKVADVHGGRGCPFTCNFCYHHSMPRYRPIPDMIADAKWLIEKYNINMLNFEDDLVIASPARARELIEGIKTLPKKIEFTLTCRFDILERFDDDLLREMKKAGLRNMGLGVESGSQKILDVINKKITVAQIRKGFQRLKKFGIFPTGCIQIGQLGETNEDVQRSMDLMLETLKENKYINWSFTITTPFPGTELYKIALEKGLLKDHKDFYEKYKNTGNRKLNTITANLSQMSDQEIRDWQSKLNKVYLAEKKKLNGHKVWFIERLRMKLSLLNSRLNKTWDKHPDSNIIKAFRITTNSLHDLCQNILDRFRLYFLGVYKIKIS